MSALIRKGRNLMMEADSLTVSVQKAINNQEIPTKIKHVRSIIIGTHHEQGGSTFWATAQKLPLQSQGPACWKFAHTLHKLIRDGHENMVFDSMKYISWMKDLARVWSHLPDNFGPLNAHYLKMLAARLTFHKRHIKIKGNLEISSEVMMEETGNDANGYYEFSVELLDLMDDVMNLQATVFDQLERMHENSMTPTGQCKLYPLILCVQDSCQLYDYLVKTLFKLHKAIQPDTLAGHRDRFLSQYRSAKKFYIQCSNLQYFRGLIQVPLLPDTPPNFLVASEISRHRKPVAIVAGEESEEVDTSPPPAPEPTPPAPLIEPKVTPPQPPQPDARDTVIAQLQQQIQHLKNELAHVKKAAIDRIGLLNAEITRLKAEADGLRTETKSGQAEMAAIKRKMEEAVRELEETRENLAAAEKSAAAVAVLSKAEEHAKTSDEKFKKMREVYEKLKTEHVDLLRTNAHIKKEATSERQAKESQLQALELKQQELDRVLSDKSVVEETMQKSADEQVSHTSRLQEQIDELCQQREDYAQKLVKAESEKSELKSQMSDYQSTKSELDVMTTSATDSELKNKELQSRIEALEASQSVDKQDFTAKLAGLEDTLKQITEERDGMSEQNVRLTEEYQQKIDELKRDIDKMKADNEMNLKAQLNKGLVTSLQSSKEQVESTMEFIESEEFITHTCSADSAVNDLRKLNDDFDALSNLIKKPEDISPVDLSDHVHKLTMRVCRTMEEGKGASNRAPPDQGDELSQKCQELGKGCTELYETMSQEYSKPDADVSNVSDKIENMKECVAAMLTVAKVLVPRGDDINVDQIGELVEEEMNATQQAIQEAAEKIQAMMEKAKKRDTGVKLEVNQKILDSVTGLMNEIHQLVRKSKGLQAEIVAQGRGSSTVKDFYKKNHRWTEGLVSAAKAVGWGASTLVEKAELIMEGHGTLNELKVCSNEIAASTAQLVVSSQVKADKESTKLKDLKSSARAVKNATADVVASSNFGQQKIEEADLMDFSNLSLTQTKRVEMNTQVHILELESKLEKERKKLAEIRKRHYQLAGESEGWELDEDGNLIELSPPLPDDTEEEQAAHSSDDEQNGGS